MSQRTLVTSALPYANGPIHLGHLVEYIQTDMYVRFLKQLGKDVLYVCGDDAHGTAIEIAAKREGIPPTQFIERVKAEHIQVLRDFGISIDCYHSTHSTENEALVTEFYEKLKTEGDICSDEVLRFYCQSCSMFLPDRYVLGTCPYCSALDQYGDLCEECGHVYEPSQLESPRCAHCSNAPTTQRTHNVFFQVNNYEAFLTTWLQSAKWLQPQIRQYLQNWLEGGLINWDISRDEPYFGFPIPGLANKYFYVWFDAPIGYLAATYKWCKRNNENIADYWQSNQTEIVHFIGKDIVYFHFLYWPALLHRAGYSLPSRIHVHGHLTVNGRKMSKSRGNFITAQSYLQCFEAEHLRFYFSKLMANDLTDIDFDCKKLRAVVNDELVAKIGNFANRVFQLTLNSFNGQVETVQMNFPQVAQEVLDELAEIESAYRGIDGRRAVRHILALAAIGNRFFQQQAPWHYVWAEPDKSREVLVICLNIVKSLAITLYPILPKIAMKLANRMKLEATNWQEAGFHHSSFTVSEGEMPINKVTDYQLLRFQQGEKESFPIELKVGKVMEVQLHPNADKLFLLQVDFGSRRRQIVAALRGKVEEEALLAQPLVFVTNLQAAEIRGAKSEGMIFAAKENEAIVPISCNAAVGSLVAPKEVVISSTKLTLETYSQQQFFIQSGQVYCNNKLLLVEEKPLQVQVSDEATIG